MRYLSLINRITQPQNPIMKFFTVGIAEAVAGVTHTHGAALGGGGDAMRSAAVAEDPATHAAVMWTLQQGEIRVAFLHSAFRRVFLYVR